MGNTWVISRVFVTVTVLVDVMILVDVSVKRQLASPLMEVGMFVVGFVWMLMFALTSS
jgi:tryptophan-rich sensory protein